MTQATTRAGVAGFLPALLFVIAADAPAWTFEAGSPVIPPQPGVVPESGLSADDWAGRARASSDRGSLFEALDAFDHAVAVDPTRHDIRFEYATLLKTAGFWVRSAGQFKTVLAARPTDIAAHTGFGELLNAEYQFGAAVEEFDKALTLDATQHERERLTVGLATAQFGLGDFVAALGTLDRMLQDRPHVLPAIAFLAIAQRKMGRLDDAEKTWDRFLGLQPNVSRAKLHRIEVQELRAAISSARTGVESAPGNPEAWARLGHELRRQPDDVGAAAAFEAALRIAPERADLRLTLGCILRDQKLWREAAQQFELAGRDPISGPLALYNLAFCARMVGDPLTEAKAWRESVSLNPQDFYAYRRLLAVLSRSRGLELEQARVTLALTGKKIGDTIDPVVWRIRLSLVYGALGRTDQALHEAMEAIRTDINDIQAQRCLREALMASQAGEPRDEKGIPAERYPAAASLLEKGAIASASGRFVEAERVFRQAVQENPDDPRAIVALASSLRQRGSEAEALALLTKAQPEFPRYLYAQLDSALALGIAGRHAEAVAAALAAVEIAPSNPLGYSLLASALHGAGDSARAARALERAVALDPMDDQGAPRLLLARLYGATGKTSEAREALKGDVPQDPEEIYRISWEFVRDTYFDRTFNGQLWSDWRHRFDGRLKTPSDAIAAVSLMLASLDDRNSLLRSADQTANMMLTIRSDSAEFSETGIALTTSRSVETRRLDGNVGYISITNLFDPSLPVQMKKAAEEIRDSDAVILDLRGNQGGADIEAERITRLFVEAGVETGKIIRPAGSEVATVRETPPGEALVVPKEAPVVVLVDHNTASSAESLAGSLREAGRATLVGEATHGKAGVQLPLLLPGGITLLVVSAEHADRKGQLYTGKGIRPDVAIDGASRATLGQGSAPVADPALEKAREIIDRKLRKKP